MCHIWLTMDIAYKFIISQLHNYLKQVAKGTFTRKYWPYHQEKMLRLEHIPELHQYHHDEIGIFFQVPKQHYHMP